MTEPTLARYSRDLFHELTALPAAERRYMLYHPTDHTGWGNKIRGLMLSQLLALATRRLLVVRDVLLQEFLRPPEGCEWDYRAWRRELKAWTAETRTIELHLTPENWNEAEWQAYGTASMDELFPERVLVVREGTGFTDQLIRNPRYAGLWQSLGLDTTSKLSWVGTLGLAFLNRPSPKLRRRTERLRTRLGLRPGDRFGVLQFRTFFDIGSPRKALVANFLAEARRVLAEERLEGLPLLIATDDAAVTRELARALKEVGPTLVARTPVVHTGYLHTGLLRLVERVLRRLLGREVWFGDLWAWLPPPWRPRPHTAVLAEWTLYGDATLALSSFTSFAAYAMARTGNKAALYRFDAKTKRIEPLRNEHYFF